MKRVQYLLIGIIVIILNACGTFEHAQKLDPKTNYFPADKNEVPTVLKDVSVNANSLKQLLIVPSTDYFLEMGKNLMFFDSVMTTDQLEIAIANNGLADKIKNLSGKDLIKKSYTIYKPFVILELTKEKKEKAGWYAGLALYNPQNDSVIFQNEISLDLWSDGWTDQATMFPLFNSLLDYLRKQKK